MNEWKDELKKEMEEEDTDRRTDGQTDRQTYGHFLFTLDVPISYLRNCFAWNPSI